MGLKGIGTDIKLYRHTSAILWVPRQTSVIKGVTLSLLVEGLAFPL